MNCNTGRFTKKKIIWISSLAVGAAAATYFVFTATNSAAIAAVIPAISVFAICPAMCAAVGGVLWAMNRFSSKKNHENIRYELTSNKQEETKREGLSYCSTHDDKNQPSRYTTYDTLNKNNT
jgi:hypothetical protein